MISYQFDIIFLSTVIIMVLIHSIALIAEEATSHKTSPEIAP